MAICPLAPINGYLGHGPEKSDNLYAVVRHALGHALVGGHHAAAEALVLALNGERATAVPDPARKLRRRVFAQPGDEEIEDFIVVDRAPVRWVRYKYVGSSAKF